MMRKSSWIIAILFATYVAPFAMADTTYDITLTSTSGPSANGTWSENSAGALTSLVVDGYIFNPSLTSNTNNLNLANVLMGNAGTDPTWTLWTGSAGNAALTLSVSGAPGCPTGKDCQIIFYTGSTSFNGKDGTGPTWESASVPEPPVYLLALLGVFFTRNRITQGLRQAIRWNH